MSNLNAVEFGKAVRLYKASYLKSFNDSVKNQDTKKMNARALVITGLFITVAAAAAGLMLPGLGLFIAPPLLLLGAVLTIVGLLKNRKVGHNPAYYQKAAESITTDLMRFASVEKIKLSPENILTVLEYVPQSTNPAASERREREFKALLQITKPGEKVRETFKEVSMKFSPLFVPKSKNRMVLNTYDDRSQDLSPVTSTLRPFKPFPKVVTRS